MYCIICTDKPDHLAVRLENRPDHVAYLSGQAAVKAAGPFLAEDGETMIGSMVILDTDSRAAAQAFVDADPYTKAGLFAAVELRPWKHVIGGLADPKA